ncbi:MAG TPA: ATP-binding cassette domain-containing protein [Candidatus Dormibacteraeota bacterium]|nr:ATP-binding cassette domain-containing protein [Candidatus Dormibacteraeota bacterium]
MRLVATDIRKRFGELAALDGVSLAVDEAQIVGIAGPNGAGKSTLFDVISGHSAADGGKVELDGQDVTRLPAYRRARLGLGRTFQTPIVPTELTVAEVLTAARVAWPVKVPDVELTKVLELLALDVDKGKIAGLLGTLERRKLLLACLLLRRPHLLLLDEPCSGLLAGEIQAIEGTIRHIRDETKVAIVVVEHRLELLSAISDRVMVMDQGRVIVEGSAAEAFAHPDVQRAYFAVPPKKT